MEIFISGVFHWSMTMIARLNLTTQICRHVNDGFIPRLTFYAVLGWTAVVDSSLSALSQVCYRETQTAQSSRTIKSMVGKEHPATLIGQSQARSCEQLSFASYIRFDLSVRH